LHVTYPADDLDFPLVPPPLVDGGRKDFFWFNGPDGFRVVLTEVTAVPTPGPSSSTGGEEQGSVRDHAEPRKPLEVSGVAGN
jgi:hypothetical protein